MGIESGPKIELGLGSGNWREEMWLEIFDKARKRGKIRHARVGDWEFDYALINPKDRYGSDRKSTTGEQYQYTGDTVTFWIKDAEKEGRIGLNEGDTSFVLENEVPEKFRDLIGLHEFVEAKIGKEKHAEACYVELSELFKNEEQFIEEYATWLFSKFGDSIKKKDLEKLQRGYFGRAIPEFIQYLVDTSDNPVQVLRKFRTELEQRLSTTLAESGEKVESVINTIKDKVLKKNLPPSSAESSNP